MARPVFVSYSRADRDGAFELVARMEAMGIECWIAPRDIAPAAEWAAEIIDAISTARLMVLVFSINSNDSPQVRREVERAVHKRVPIIAFRVDDVLPEKSLEYFLSAQHWLDAFPGPREAYYDKLFQYLKRVLDAPATISETGSHARLDTSTIPVTIFPATEIQHIEAHLAKYLGPIARLLVKRAASRSSNIDDLMEQLSHELETEHDRRAFMAARPPHPGRGGKS
jgi:TIR domain